jgi:phospholipid/cholesterol/gamma-HCH transport system substrate-binding protein
MKKINAETIVGIIMLTVFIIFAYLAIKQGMAEMSGSNYYSVTAEFDSVSGLRPGASVEISGVGVGKVERIELDKKRYMAKVYLQINAHAKLSDDTVASIRTSGIIGDKFIELLQGNSKKLLADGGVIRKTKSATNLEELIGEYIQGQV